MHAVVVVNGELPEPGAASLGRLLGGADLLIAVDGGLQHCAAVGVWPNVLIGDLDSASVELIDQARSNQVDVRSYPTDKDATDLELALEYAVERGASSITVVAPFGGRLDHQLASVSLLASQRWSAVTIAATDGQRNLWVVRDRCALTLDVGATVSLMPWHGPVHGVSTQGLQWPLSGDTLELGSSRGVSNIVVDATQVVRIDGGVLLVVCDPTAA